MGHRTVHLVPQFHHDVEYLLPLGPYQEICYENLLVAQRMLSSHPSYAFVVEQVFLLETFLQEYPGMREAFRQYRQEGRLEIAPATYTAGDFHMPSGESFIRQALVGKSWCRRHLGFDARVLNANDCAGGTAQMPQLARLCGYDYLVFERAVDDATRKSEILWTGIDGTRVPVYWLPEGYSGWKPFSRECETSSLDAAVAKASEHALCDDVVLAHGGDFRPPYQRGPQVLDSWNQNNPDTHVAYTTYMRGLGAVDWGKAVPYQGEWNPDRQGCYSSRIRVKQLNRACEALLFSAEAANVVAILCLGIGPDEDGLLRAWKLAFLNQSHDALWGTVLDEAYCCALDRAKRLRLITRNLLESRLEALLAAEASQAVDGHRLIAFNPLPWRRTAYVEWPPDGTVDPFDATLESFRDRHSRATAQHRTVLKVDLPACGYRILDAPDTAGAATAIPNSELELANTPFEFRLRRAESCDKHWSVKTPLYELALSDTGVISTLVRTEDGKEFVDPLRPWFNAICIPSDRGDLWQYYEGPLSDGGPFGMERDLVPDPYPLADQLSRTGKRIIGFAADNRGRRETSVAVQHLTKDRLVLRITSELSSYWPNFRDFQQCEYRILLDQTVTFYATEPRIDFHLVTHHIKGRWYRMRAAFFTDIREGRIVHEIPFGRFQRPQGEFAAQNFMVYSDGDKGVALFNRGLPGNNVTDGVMMLSLMRSVDISNRGVESSLALEEGQQHSFQYAIVPFAGDPEIEALALARQGMEFIVPPHVAQSAQDHGCAAHESSRRVPKALELLQIDPPAINCTAVYPDAGRIVVRLYESEGNSAQGVVRINCPFKNVYETDAMLKEPKALRNQAGCVELAFRPFEIKTLVIEPSDYQASEPNG